MNCKIFFLAANQKRERLNSYSDSYSGTSTGTSKTISNLAAGKYYVKVDLLNADWSRICTKEGFYEVVAAQALPIVTIADITVQENSGLYIAEIKFSSPLLESLSLRLTTSNSTAIAGQDYVHLDTLFTIPKGAISVSIPIHLIINNIVEQTEFFKVSVLGLIDQNSKSSASITIIDDGPGDLCGQLNIQVTANTLNITGLYSPIYILQIFDKDWNKLPSSYVGASTGTSRVIENLAVGKYYVKVDLLNADWTPICKKEGFYEVMGGGGNLPTLSISENLTVKECSGSVTLIVSVINSQNIPITINIKTEELTAKSGIDFLPLNKNFVIQAGETTLAIEIILSYNPEPEDIENFEVLLSSISNVNIPKPTSIVTILDCAPDLPLFCDFRFEKIQDGIKIIPNTIGNSYNTLQVFNSSWNSVYECYFNCGFTNTIVDGLAPGIYFVKAQQLSSSWEVLCRNEQYIDVTSNKIASTNNLPFQANKKGQAVQLQWTSNTGERNDYFIIERSNDGQLFEKIAEKSAQGLADEMQYFSEIDNTPQTGDNYYRLRLVYLDGSELLSEVQKVHFSDSKDFVLYPNPAHERVFLDASAFDGASVQVQIINALGRMIYSEVIQKNNQDQLDIDLSALESGVFNVICTGENGYRVAKTLVVDDLK